MALILTRGIGERILIGDDIVVEVRAVMEGHQVRLSIDAPRQVPIHRAEVYKAVSATNDASSRSNERILGADQLVVNQPVSIVT